MIVARKWFPLASQSQFCKGVFTCLLPTGGLAEEVDEKVLHAAFIPFGDLIDIQIPLDYETGEPGGDGGSCAAAVI